MVTLQEQFLHSLMKKFAHPAAQTVIQGLEPAEKELFQGNLAGDDPMMYLITPKRILSMMHPSWYGELLEHTPKVLQSICERFLQGKQEGPLREFVLGYCVNQWPERGKLGPETVQDGDFSWLLEYSYENMTALFDLLGVYDLVDEVRRIVDKRKLQMILVRLHPFQQKFLRALLLKSLPTSASQINVSTFLTVEADVAKKRLQQRGLERFAMAIEKADPLLLWHFFHRLERFQAERLQQVGGQEFSDRERARAKQQVIQAYQFLQRMEKA